MSLDLGAPVAAYFAAENGDDPEAFGGCFAEHATVYDDDQIMKGLSAIKSWTPETKAKYQHTVEPLAATQNGGAITVIARLAGNFPGSPVEQVFIFVLEGDKIVSLKIE